PAVYHACQDEGVPVVQSLHNFRPLCANGLLFRDNHLCEDCLKGSLMPGIFHRCSQKSLIISAMVTRMIRSHRKMHTWRDKVSLYVTATEFTRQKYITAGFSPNKIFIKPNFVGPVENNSFSDQAYALYIGRLSDEKGVDVLIRAWKDLPDIPLKIAGDGPNRLFLSGYIQRYGLKNIEVLGHVDGNKYHELMSGARFLVIPSICYENFPRIAAEAFAYGLPVAASRLGSLQEVIDHGINGLLFEPGSEQSLRQIAEELYRSAGLPEMRAAAREKYAAAYSPEKNYETLLEIYERALYTR
ncbi:MAG: glycosyltransferase, partial [Candidatus Omnitrophica bacterium]|nr:glycosyltransferase [Candidatus Omnitrophota bacterium]